jgi:DNA mismatch repair protein MutS
MNQMQQYHEAKNRPPGMILLFRSGDFFELFGEDAETVSRLLGLCLTQRTDRDTGEKLFVAGFLHQSLELYLRKLLKAGHRVAICDQVEPLPLEKAPEKVQRTLFDPLTE